MTVKHIDSFAEFKEIINSGKVVAIEFWGTWFGLTPIFEQLAKKITGVEFYKVNINHQVQIKQEVGFRVLPTFQIFRHGKKVDELVGSDPNKLEQLLQDAQTLASDIEITVKEINSYTRCFKEIISSGRVVAIYFWAKCGPSRTISPIFEQLSRKTPGVEFYKVDVDEQEQISQVVGIRSIPTFLIFRDGKKVDKLVGADPNKLDLLLQDAQTRGSDFRITVKEINSYTQFKEIINSGRVVAIYFRAKCGPCRVISPVFEELSRKTPGVEFYMVDVDEQEQVSQEVGILAVPTFMIFREGIKVGELADALSNQLEALLQYARSFV